MTTDKPLPRGKKAAATRERNQRAARDAAIEAQAAAVHQKLFGGEPLVYGEYQVTTPAGITFTKTGWYFVDRPPDDLGVNFDVINQLIRTERAKKDKKGWVWLSSPQQYAADRDRHRRREEENRRRWLDHWRGRLRIAADDDENLNAVIRELIAWGGTHSLTDEYEDQP